MSSVFQKMHIIFPVFQLNFYPISGCRKTLSFQFKLNNAPSADFLWNCFFAAWKKKRNCDTMTDRSQLRKSL